VADESKGVACPRNWSGAPLICEGRNLASEPELKLQRKNEDDRSRKRGGDSLRMAVREGGKFQSLIRRGEPL